MAGATWARELLSADPLAAGRSLTADRPTRRPRAELGHVRATASVALSQHPESHSARQKRAQNGHTGPDIP